MNEYLLCAQTSETIRDTGPGGGERGSTIPEGVLEIPMGFWGRF